MTPTASGHALLPITGTPLEMHDCHNPNSIGLIDVDHSVRKHPGQMPSAGRIVKTKSTRLATYRRDDSLNLIKEACTQFRAYDGVPPRRFNIFMLGVRVEDMMFHRPTICRRRADTSSPGMP